MNTLHSSPLGSYVNDGNFPFILPDCFASDPQTFPDTFESFQRFNLAITSRNARKASFKETLSEALRSFISDPRPGRWGVGPASIAELTRIVASARSRPERLRLAQFPLVANLFLAAMHRCKPGLGVIFTNHVAAMQHRYWYAAFPGDFPQRLYDDAWVERYRHEITIAMSLLDRWLARFHDFALANDYILVVATSMGQHSNTAIRASHVRSSRVDHRLEHPGKFLARLLGDLADGSCPEGAMVPQYTFRFPTMDRAGAAAERLRDLFDPKSASASGLAVDIDQRAEKLTLTARVTPASGSPLIGGEPISLEDLEFVELEVDDHHAGKHRFHRGSLRGQ